MFNTFELIVYFFLPAYVAMFAVAYVMRRRNREPVPSLMPEKAAMPRGAAGAPENFGEWAAINFGPLGCLIFLPLLFLLAAVSIPCSVTAGLVQRYREGQFAKRMKQAGRSMSWEEAQLRLKEPQPGTLLLENLSMKGPTRLWWTPDAVPSLSPFPFHSSRDEGFRWIELEFKSFGEWSRTRYTSEYSGSAILVEQPRVDRRAFWKDLKEKAYLSVYWRGPWGKPAGRSRGHS